MEDLIPIVNKLQDVFHSVGMLDTIDLPQIAVVGCQSSGKSSVLEAIVGRDFLPRGTGIVTRRPLVLQLVNIAKNPNTPKGQEEYGEFLHIPNKRFYDFNEIRKEIQDETDRITGKNKGVSSLPIHLKIYSPYVLNLTLIDLPGITKVPVGDQPKDIEHQIRKMILQFISKPNCVILAITPANMDIANSDAIKIAKEVDRKGTRTLGVLTKLDLMDPGTDAMDVLTGKVIPLRRGFIGVVNRGQKDIESNKSIKDAIADEAAFFQNHPAYKSIANRMGTPFLAKTLNQILLNHIRVCLPEIKNKISALIVQAQQRLATYGDPLSESMSQGALLLQLLTKFATQYVDAIDGRTTDMSSNEIFGGARINNIFTKKYTPYLLKLDACEGLTEQDIKMHIRNAKGPRTSLFIPEAAFEMLVKKQVKLLEEPSLRCVDQVFDELASIVDYCDKDLVRFPNLQEKVKEFVINLLREYVKPLKTFISDLVAIELAYINTNHPDFFGGGQTAIMLIERLNMNRNQPQINSQLPQQQNYTVTGRQPISQTIRTQPPPPKQIPQETMNQKGSIDNDDDDWFDIEVPSKYKKTPQKIKPIGLATNPGHGKQKSQNKKNNFFTNFFGKQEREEEEDFTDNTSRVNMDAEPEPVEEQSYPSHYSSNIDTLSLHEAYSQSYKDRERMEMEIIRSLLTAYFSIVRKNISDSVPKSIMHFLVNKSKNELQSELVRNLYKEELFGELLKENDEIAAKRKATAKMLKVLQNAQQIINEVRDMRM